MEIETIDGRIFLDFDETLVSSFFCERPNMVNEYIDEIDGRYEYIVASLPSWNGGSVITFVRPLASELIEFCRELVGVENTSILTLGTNDYIQAALAKLVEYYPAFKFPPHRIYTREDIGYDCPIFKDTNNILLDNENYRYHITQSRKVKFLYQLPPEKFIQVAFFDARIHNIEDDEGYLEMLKYRIIETLKTKV